MNVTKKESSSPKENWKWSRRRYTWYLHGFFGKRFDRQIWWKKASKIEPVAALYELARRHPLVRDTWLRNFAAARRNPPKFSAMFHEEVYRCECKRLGLPVVRMIHSNFGGQETSVPPSLSEICRLGFTSWADLERGDQMNWIHSVGYLKGLDYRWEELQCRGP